MYFLVVVLLLFIFPAASVTYEAVRSSHAVNIIVLTGKWSVFWAVGIRLFVAGGRQVAQPRFTAEEIFGIHDRESFAIVRELGFANLSMGLLGIITIARADWVVPTAILGGLYYGLAGTGHLFQKNRNTKENTAMVSDALEFLVLAVFALHALV